MFWKYLKLKQEFCLYLEHVQSINKQQTLTESWIQSKENNEISNNNGNNSLRKYYVSSQRTWKPIRPKLMAEKKNRQHILEWESTKPISANNWEIKKAENQ